MELEAAISRSGRHAARRRTGIQPQHLGYISAGVDLALLAAAGVLANHWADSTGIGPTGSIAMVPLAKAMACALLYVLFGVCCHLAKLHDPQTLTGKSPIAHSLKATLCFGAPPAAALLLSLPFMTADDDAVQAFVIWLSYFALAAVALALLSRALFHVMFAAFNGILFVPQRIAIVGSSETSRRLIRWIQATNPHSVQVVGIFDDRSRRRLGEPEAAGPVSGSTVDLIALYQRDQFDKVVVALPHSAEDRTLQLLRRLRQLPVDIVLAPDLMGFRSARHAHAEIAGLKLYSLAQRPIREPQRVLKGAIDRLLAALAILVLSPLLLLVSVAIKLDSPGPVLFRQPRQGLGDTLFDVYKFRTMRVELADAIGREQTKRDDPRVTRLGTWLRRSSIDELPQLLNVLRGEMSIVGPRPHTPHMLVAGKRIFDLVDEYSFRHRVKPGITGLAQVNGYRGAIETPEQLRTRVDYDLYYIDHWSLWLDLKIIFRTAAICVSGVNAF